RRDRDAAAYRTALVTVGDEARNLSDLVADLLWLARNDAGSVKYNFESVRVTDLIGSIFGSLLPLAEARGITLQTNIAADPDSCAHADRTALRRVILILLDNAIKFTGSGGTVEIRAGQTAGSTIVEVYDNGAGIPPEDLPFIFDRFYQSDRARSN